MFEEEARKLDGIESLAQGTIYPDILESGPVKAHHNVGGLPEDLRFELVEPSKLLYKDEVRAVGQALGLPDGMVNRQPFPGPGLGVRCLGAITAPLRAARAPHRPYHRGGARREPRALRSDAQALGHHRVGVSNLRRGATARVRPARSLSAWR